MATPEQERRLDEICKDLLKRANECPDLAAKRLSIRAIMQIAICHLMAEDETFDPLGLKERLPPEEVILEQVANEFQIAEMARLIRDMDADTYEDLDYLSNEDEGIHEEDCDCEDCNPENAIVIIQFQFGNWIDDPNFNPECN